MLGNHITWTVHIPGTLAANINIRFTVPIDCVITHVSAVTSNDSAAILDLGISTNTDSVIDAQTIGDSNVPVVFTRDDFAANANPTGRFAKGDILVATLDYDGAAGTAGADFTLVITALEG